MSEKLAVEIFKQLDFEIEMCEKCPRKNEKERICIGCLDNAKESLLNYIEQLQQENEEKTKKYAKIRDEICDYLDSNRFCENFENVGNEENVRKNILEILLKEW